MANILYKGKTVISGGGGITFPINSVRSPFTNSDFTLWFERGKNFANSNFMSPITMFSSNSGYPNLQLGAAGSTVSNSNGFTFRQDRAISFWLNFSRNSNLVQVIVCKENDTSYEWIIWYDTRTGPDLGKITLFVFDSSANLLCRLGQTVTAGTYQHWVWNYTHSSQTFDLYLNGAYQSSATISGTYNVTSNPVVVATKPPYSFFSQGFISQLILANRKLTTTEISTLYNSGNGFFII